MHARVMGDLQKHDFLSLEPDRVLISAGSNAYWIVKNNSAAKLGIKVKCTDTYKFKLRPIFAVLEPGATCPICVNCGGRNEDNSAMTSVDARPPPTRTGKERLVISFVGMLPEEECAEEVHKRMKGSVKPPDVRIPIHHSDKCNGETECPTTCTTLGEGVNANAKHGQDD